LVCPYLICDEGLHQELQHSLCWHVFFLLPDSLYCVLVQQSALVSCREGINLDIWSHSWVFCHPAICDCQTPCCKGQVSVATSSSLIILTNGGWCLQFKPMIFWAWTTSLLATLNYPHPFFLTGSLMRYNFTMYRTNSGISLLHLSGTL